MSATGSSPWHGLNWRIVIDPAGSVEPKCYANVNLNSADKSPEVPFTVKDLDALIARLVAMKEVLETSQKILPSPRVAVAKEAAAVGGYISNKSKREYEHEHDDRYQS